MLRGKRTERYLRQMKGGERVAAVKISAAQTPPKNFGIRNRIEPLRSDAENMPPAYFLTR